MASLLRLPQEILQCILLNTDPAQLAALCLTCKTLNGFISGNTLLHKKLYLMKYDDPGLKHYDWQKRLHEAVSLEKMLGTKDNEARARYLPLIDKAVAHLLAHTDGRTSSRTVAALTTLFTSFPEPVAEPTNEYLEPISLLHQSSLFGRVGEDLPGTYQAAESTELRQLSAKLHCLYGIPADPWSDSIKRSHPYARARVYDLRYYTSETMWGPFTDDGSRNVDWEHVEAIMIILGYNMRLYCQRSAGRFPAYRAKPFVGVSPKSYNCSISQIPPCVKGALDLKDPYNVSGTWKRVVCFLDYSDLYAFNFSRYALAGPWPREPIYTEEAIRLIVMFVQVTAIEKPGPNDGQSLPVVHFSGVSRSLHAEPDPNANSRIRGTVRLTPAGEVHWTTVSVFVGEERWRSEGIQVGGLQSARGVWGTWFDKDYDPEGPAGPTAYWKVNDNIGERLILRGEERALWD